MTTPRAPLVLLVAALTFASCNDAAAPQAHDAAPRETVSEPSQQPELEGAVAAADDTFSNERIRRFRLWRAMKTVRKLAGDEGIGIRERATKNERRAARLVARRFESYGYQVRFQKFEVDGGMSRNVIASWPGSIANPLVIGAHIDTVPGSPGANDNASGVAAILEAARLAAGKQPVKFIRWVAFGAEEYGDSGTHHDGSAVYVDRLGNRARERSPGALSVDMVADGKPLLTGSFGIGPRILGRMIHRRIERNSNIGIEYRTLCDCSDNGPFEHAGIPGAFMYSGDEPDYHSPTDVPDNLRPKHLERTGRALLLIVRGVDRATIRTLQSH